MSERDEWSAFLAMVPPTVTHNDLEAYVRRGKGGRLVPAIRKSEALKEAEDAVRARIMARGVPKEPIGGAVTLTCVLCWPRGGHAQGEPKATAPDLDNSVKTLQDLLQGCGVMARDSQVARIDASKCWADPAGIYLKVERIGAR